MPQAIKTEDLERMSEAEIRMTRYGMSGSYVVPNVAIINVSRFFSMGLIRNVLHEIVHLYVQKLIYMYKVSQWPKEVIVDGIFERVFPELFKKQNYPVDVSSVQKIFNSRYPDIELITREASNKKVPTKIEIVGTREHWIG